MIEKQLGQNLPQNFPVIDKFENGVATSIKSIDLNAKTYQNTSALEGKLNQYVDKVSKFNGNQYAGANITENEINQRALQIAIPNSGTPAQQAVIQSVTKRAEGMGVKIIITEVK